MRTVMTSLAIAFVLAGCSTNAAVTEQPATTIAAAPAPTTAPTIAPTARPTSVPTATTQPSPVATPYKFSMKNKPVWDTRDLLDAELVPVTTQPCADESQLRSENSEQVTFLRFANATTQTVKVHWINYVGERDPDPEQLTTLEKGEHVDITTYVTHPFVVLDATNTCLTIVQPAPQPGLFTIDIP